MSEPIIINDVESSKKTDFMKISGNLLMNINYKVAFFLFIVGIIVFSDLFISNIINKFQNSADGECPNTKGTMIQLMFIIIAYIIIDLIVKYEFL